MQIWVVCRNGRPSAVFSTAGSANEFVAGNGGATSCDAKWFILDACAGAQQHWDFRIGASQVAGDQQ